MRRRRLWCISLCKPTRLMEDSVTITRSSASTTRMRLSKLEGGFRSEPLSLTQLLRRSRFVIQTGHFVQAFFIRRNLKPPIGDYTSYCRRVLNMYAPGESWDKLVWELERMVAHFLDYRLPHVALHQIEGAQKMLAKRFRSQPNKVSTIGKE
jgi:hypothetical protein